MPTLVVRAGWFDYDVYIGRGSKWGNPFSHRPSGQPGVIYVPTRAEAVKRHREWIQTQPQLLAQLHELKGKRLGCPGCDPDGQECHGHVLAELADALPEV